MALKFIFVSTLVVVACSVDVIPIQSQQQSSATTSNHHQNHNSDPDYSFQYSVHDSWTGDIKSQQENRRGDRVQGQYRMMESDGTERIVDYSADDRNGFNAIVRHQPPTAVLARVVVPHIASPAYAISNSRMVQYYDTPLVISNRVHHH